MDLATAQEHLNCWLDASKALAKGETVSIEGRTIVRHSEAAEQVRYWSGVVNRLTSAAAGDASPGLIFPPS